jgi:acyl carrier protein
MTLEEFVENFANQFEDTDASEIKAETAFHDLDEWSSMIVLAIIAMANIDYDVTLTGDDIKNAVTVKDLYDVVAGRME